MIGVDTTSFLVIVGTAALAGLTVTLLGPRAAIPVVVVELLLGIVVGPEVAGIAHVDAATEFFSRLGLGMLFFFAGYEIDFERLRGQPLRLGIAGWVISLLVAYGLAGALDRKRCTGIRCRASVRMVNALKKLPRQQLL